MGKTAQQGKVRAGWVAVAALAVGVVACTAFGLQDFFSLSSLAKNHDLLAAFVAQHLLLAILAYMLAYIAVALLSIPGAAALSIVGGYLFGWMLSAPITLVAATTGALITFQIVKTVLGEALAKRSGPYVGSLMKGFAKNAFSYLLFLRLVPAFPFFAVNTVAGLARIDRNTFLFATILGMIPGSLVFGIVGSGLGSALNTAIKTHETCVAVKSEALCPYDVSMATLVSPQILTGFLALGLLALIPVFVKKWRRHEI
jgi:uncharacterized membrane protein YdjX (TVP38/TMEM64 family)